MPDILGIQFAYSVTLSETKGLVTDAPIRSSENENPRLMSKSDTVARVLERWPLNKLRTSQEEAGNCPLMEEFAAPQYSGPIRPSSDGLVLDCGAVTAFVLLAAATRAGSVATNLAAVGCRC